MKPENIGVLSKDIQTNFDSASPEVVLHSQFDRFKKGAKLVSSVIVPGALIASCSSPVVYNQASAASIIDKNTRFIPMIISEEGRVIPDEMRVQRAFEIGKRNYGVEGALITRQDGSTGDIFKVSNVLSKGQEMGFTRGQIGYFYPNRDNEKLKDMLIFYPENTLFNGRILIPEIEQVTIGNKGALKAEDRIVFRDAQTEELTFMADKASGAIVSYEIPTNLVKFSQSTSSAVDFEYIDYRVLHHSNSTTSFKVDTNYQEIDVTEVESGVISQINQLREYRGLNPIPNSFLNNLPQNVTVSDREVPQFVTYLNGEEDQYVEAIEYIGGTVQGIIQKYGLERFIDTVYIAHKSNLDNLSGYASMYPDKPGSFSVSVEGWQNRLQAGEEDNSDTLPAHEIGHIVGLTLDNPYMLSQVSRGDLLQILLRREQILKDYYDAVSSNPNLYNPYKVGQNPEERSHYEEHWLVDIFSRHLLGLNNPNLPLEINTKFTSLFDDYLALLNNNDRTIDSAHITSNN